MENKSELIIKEIAKVINGKKEVIEQVWLTLLAGGHILLEDVPGVGKTTLAKALSRVIELSTNRIQFTPDVIASDITGFTMFDKSINNFVFKEGAIMCNLLLGDEINRTSARTQSALLEAMQEQHITVDSVTYELPKPFHVIATQNPVGSAGTQSLPSAQIDRFTTCLSLGYPSIEAQVEMLKNHQGENPVATLNQILTREELISYQIKTREVKITDELLFYISALTEATRQHEYIVQGVSPRGALALTQMAKAKAFYDSRSYVIPRDITDVWLITCAHRVIISPTTTQDADQILSNIIEVQASPEFTASYI